MNVSVAVHELVFAQSFQETLTMFSLKCAHNLVVFSCCIIISSITINVINAATGLECFHYVVKTACLRSKNTATCCNWKVFSLRFVCRECKGLSLI